MRKSLLSIGAALLTLAVAGQGLAEYAVPSVPDGAVTLDKGAKVYIIRMVDDPAVSYDGGIKGLPATKSKAGGRFNPNSAAARKYTAHLNKQHADALSSVGAVDKKVYSYVYSLNGFAAELTATQASALEARADVMAVWSDELRQIETNASPGFLGLEDPNSAWAFGYLGEDVIIGVIDTGIWPEHASVSDQADLSNASGASGKNNLAYGPPPAHWTGGCQSGERISQDDCNNKLIGIKHYLAGFTIGRGAGNQSGNSGIIEGDFKSGRDGDDTSHGTHTATTAGGNADVPANIYGVDVGTVSGIAPRARIASYKTCWNGEGCFTSDLVAAIDQAVADGVDVINYSIGSSAQNILGPDDIAFLFAADAGVFVATSNGNAGPGANTVGSPAGDPWITSVGASTRTGFTSAQALQVNSPAGLAGLYQAREGAISRPLNEGAVTGDLVVAEPLNGCDPLANAAAVAGNIAYIQRGACAFSQKLANAVAAGASAMLVFNSVGGPPIVMGGTFIGQIPSAMIRLDDGTTIKAAIDGGATVNVTLDASIRVNEPIDGNVMAGFSSRGPNGGAINIVKPDVTAPGVSILAGVGEEPFFGPQGEAFGYRSGTSMSSPHVAGIGAIMKQAHPDWSPAMIRSALVTTGRQDVVKEDGATPADPFDMGGGHVVPNSALDPGLVYDAGFFDYLAYLCGANPGSVSQGACDFLESIGFSLDPTNLNYPSIGVASFAGTKTVTRTVMSVTAGTATYNASVDAPPGVAVTVSPSSITLDEGESASFDVTFTTTPSAVSDQWAFGALTWSDGTHNVRSPIAVRPTQLAAPDEVVGSGIEGSLGFDVQFGYAGDYTAGTHGLAPANTQAGSVGDDPNNDVNAALGTCDFGAPFPYPCTGGTWHAVGVDQAGEGAAFLRVSLFDDFTDGNDDLDLYVFDGGWPFSGGFRGGSGSPTSAEQVDVVLPGGSQYYVFVHGWQTDGPDANYTLFDWSFGLDDDRGNMTVTAPALVTLGAIETITVDWAGLDAGTKYLGAVSHSDAGGLLGLTLVNISTE